MSLTRITSHTGDYADIGKAFLNGAVEIFNKDIVDGMLIILNEIMLPFILILLLICIPIYLFYIGWRKKHSDDDLSVHIRNVAIAFGVFIILGAYSVLANSLFGQIVGR